MVYQIFTGFCSSSLSSLGDRGQEPRPIYQLQALALQPSLTLG